MQEREVKKTRTIGFRVTEEVWQQLEKEISGTDETPHDWCREVVLERLRKEQGLTKNQRLIYEELARVRYLVGYGFGLLADGHLTPQEWETKRQNADQSGAEIAQVLLDRQRANGTT